MMFITGCKEEIAFEAPGEREGQGEIQDFSVELDTRVALYSDQDVEQGKIPELVYGRMDVHFVTISSIVYIIDWNDLDDFKNLQKGENLHFRGTDYIARVEKQKRNYRVVRLNEL